MGSGPGCSGDIVADELEGVEHRSVPLDDISERLVPSERMSRHDRRFMPANDRKQLGKADTRGDFLKRRQAVNQEVAFKGRDFHTRKNAQGQGPGGQVRELVGHPLVVMLGDDQAVEAQMSSMFDQLGGVDNAVGGVAFGVQVVIDFHEVGHFSRETGESEGGCASLVIRLSPAAIVTNG